MVGLLYKQFINNRKNLFLILLGILFFFGVMCVPLGFSGEDERRVYSLMMSGVCVCVFIIAGTVQQNFFSVDEKKSYAYFVTSTPLSVKGQVLSMYYFSLIVSLVVLALYLLFANINAVIMGFDSGMGTVAFIVFCVHIFICSVEYPFIVLFGSKSGNNYKIALLLLLFFAFIVYILFGDLSVFGSVDDFLNWYEKLTSPQTSSDIILFLATFMPVGTFAIYYASYKLSCCLYLKGVERYDS